MRKVCSPGICSLTRTFTTWSLRTTELRSSAWFTQMMVSATVKTALLSRSAWRYSPTRNDVTCQAVRWSASRCVNACISASLGGATPRAVIRVRKESTTTMAGFLASTSRMIRSRTPVRPLFRTSSVRLRNSMAAPTLELSKKEYCC